MRHGSRSSIPVPKDTITSHEAPLIMASVIFAPLDFEDTSTSSSDFGQCAMICLLALSGPPLWIVGPKTRILILLCSLSHICGFILK